MDTNSLAHTKWECKYHLVFAQKYRRRIIYGELRQEIGQILRDLCNRKGVGIIEAEACPITFTCWLESLRNIVCRKSWAT